MNIKVEFSQRLHECLKEKWPDLTQKEMSALLDIKQATLSEWLTAKKMPGLEKLIEICFTLNVAVDWLATGRGYKRPQSRKSKILETLTPIQISQLKNIINELCEE